MVLPVSQWGREEWATYRDHLIYIMRFDDPDTDYSTATIEEMENVIFGMMPRAKKKRQMVSDHLPYNPREGF